jgi:hypothetical protein
MTTKFLTRKHSRFVHNLCPDKLPVTELRWVNLAVNATITVARNEKGRGAGWFLQKHRIECCKPPRNRAEKGWEPGIHKRVS